MRSAWPVVIVSIVVALVVFSPLAYGLRRALPHNPVRLPGGNDIFPAAYFPQGWSFFTRDAREPRLFVFRQEGAKWKPANAGPSFAPKYWLGFDRSGRAQGIEVGLLYAELPKDAWHECQSVPMVCLEREVAAFSLQNVTPSPTLCGRIGIALIPPVPWEWARTGRDITMPSKVIVGDVQCPR